MKKNLSFFLTLLLAITAFAGSLTVDKKYPRWFRLYNGLYYVVNSGTSAVPDGKLFNQLVDAGVNGFRTHILLNTSRRQNCPYLLGKGASVDNNWNGWNDSLFNQLKNDAKRLEEKKCILFIVVGGTPMRKQSKGEWGTHCWSTTNGGPIPSNLHGVREFYKLGQSGFVYDKAYQNSWEWELKAQYRFEELLYKINSELPEDKHPNVAILLMWEISSGWPSAQKWAPHMVKLLQHITKHRPIGLGTGSPAHLNAINKESIRPVFGTFEGQDYLTRIRENPPTGKYPIMCFGFHCQPEGFYSGQKPETRCKCFVPGAETPNVAGAVENMLACVKAGINTSLPFPSYWAGIDTYVKKVCQGKHPIQGYDSEVVKNGILEFVAFFSKRAKRQSLLKRLPGKKVSQRIDKWRKK